MQVSITRSLFGPCEVRTQSLTLDLFLIALIAFLVGAICFNRTYFGDEIATLGLAYYSHGSFWKMFFALCQYKPRIIPMLIWSAIGVTDAPRVVPMVINTLAFVAIAWMVYYWAVVRCQAPRLVAWISVLAVLFSRFGMVLYFDYISGIVETFSMALFMSGILLGTRREPPVFIVRPLRRTLSVVLIIFAVFVYEPFIASAVALGVVALLDGFAGKDSQKKRRAAEFIYPLAIAILPLLLFYLATKWLAALPFSTGTDGRPVSLSLDTFKAFCLYVSNLLLGTNYGKPWLVGSLTLGARGALPLFVVSALVLVGSYIYAVIGALTQYRSRFLTSLKWLLLVGAVIAVSSLPFRHEGRWIFPAFVFLVLSLLAMFQGRRLALLLGVMLVLDAVYLATGSEFAIANVYGIRTVSRIVVSLETVQPTGHRVAVIGYGDVGWLIGGRDGGETFARVNLHDKYLLVPVVLGDKVHPAGFDFGLVYNAVSPVTFPSFSLVNRKVIEMLLKPPDRIGGASCYMVGGFGKWSDWNLHNPDMLQTSGGLLISPGADGFRSLPVASLRGHVLAYMAHSQTGQPQPMRLQINWHGKNDVFLGASISTVKVGAQDKVYATYVSPPTGADSGLVYATTQEGATGGIIIDAVCLY